MAFPRITDDTPCLVRTVIGWHTFENHCGTLLPILKVVKLILTHELSYPIPSLVVSTGTNRGSAQELHRVRIRHTNVWSGMYSTSCIESNLSDALWCWALT